MLVRPAWSRCCATSSLGVPLSFRCSIRHWGVGMSRVVRVAPGRRTAPVVASAKGASRLHATFFVHEALCAQCTLASLGHALGFHPWRPQAHFAVESVVRRVCAGVICKCSIGPTHVMTEQDSKTASEGVRMHRKCLDKTPLHPPRSSKKQLRWGISAELLLAPTRGRLRGACRLAEDTSTEVKVPEICLRSFTPLCGYCGCAWVSRTLTAGAPGQQSLSIDPSPPRCPQPVR